HRVVNSNFARGDVDVAIVFGLALSPPNSRARKGGHEGGFGMLVEQDHRTPVRTAYGRGSDTRATAARCIAQLGAIVPTMLIVFCGGKIQPDVLLTCLQEAYGDAPIVGGSAAGVIARQGFGYSGLEVGVLAFLEPRVTPLICSTHALLAGEHAA